MGPAKVFQSGQARIAFACAVAGIVVYGPPSLSANIGGEIFAVPGIGFAMLTNCTVHSGCSMTRYSLTLFIGIAIFWSAASYCLAYLWRLQTGNSDDRAA